MRYTTWIASLLLTSTATASTFLPQAVAPEHGVTILNRAAAERLVGKTLLEEPAASAVLGDVHLYAGFPYVQARYLHVTSDARWQRLLYGLPGEAPRAFGRGGAAAGEFGEPRGVAFAPDGRLFVADRVLGRVTILRSRWQGDVPGLEYVSQIDGLVQPMDVAVHDGGTPSDATDDRLLVAEAGAQRLALYDLAGAPPVRLAEYGVRGPGTGAFLYPRAVAVGRDAGRSTSDIYVADSGNHRIVRLVLRGTNFEWAAEANLPNEAVSLDTDHHGNLYAALRRGDRIWKLTPALEALAAFDGGAAPLASPRDVAIPFAWVHDHRAGAAPAWRGQGTALVLEAWGAATGVRRLDLGVEIAALVRRGASQLDFALTDAAVVQAHLVSEDGASRIVDLGVRPAGTQRAVVEGLDAAARVRLVAQSSYDASRRSETTLELLEVAPVRRVLRQNSPNPFNPSTTIAFELPDAGPVRLEVFDVTGRRIAVLVDGERDAGLHRVVWDGRDARRARVGSGIYFYRLEHAGTASVRKMVLAQ